MEAEMALSWLSDLGKSIFGNMDGLFYTLVAFVVIDYITGVCVAIHNKRLSSDGWRPWDRQEDRYFCAGVPEQHNRPFPAGFRGRPSYRDHRVLHCQ